MSGDDRGPRRTQLTGRAAILAVVVCAIVLSLAYPLREYLAQRQRIAELRQQNAEMSEDIAALRERKKRLNNPEYIKQLARERLHFVMPGEKNYIVIDDREKEGPGLREPDPEAEERPWFVNLWDSIEEADGNDSGTGDGRQP